MHEGDDAAVFGVPFFGQIQGEFLCDERAGRQRFGDRVAVGARDDIAQNMSVDVIFHRYQPVFLHVNNTVLRNHDGEAVFACQIHVRRDIHVNIQAPRLLVIVLANKDADLGRKLQLLSDQPRPLRNCDDEGAFFVRYLSAIDGGGGDAQGHADEIGQVNRILGAKIVFGRFGVILRVRLHERAEQIGVQRDHDQVIFILSLQGGQQARAVRTILAAHAGQFFYQHLACADVEFGDEDGIFLTGRQAQERQEKQSCASEIHIV